MEPKIRTKMLKNLSEKLRAKFPAIIPGCSMVKIACLDDAFLEVFFSKPSRSSITAAKEQKKRKRKGEKKFKN